MEQTNVNLQVEQVEPQRAVLAGATDNQAAAIDAFDPQQEARQLLELMGNAGVLPQETVDSLLSQDQPKALERAPLDGHKEEEPVVAELIHPGGDEPEIYR
jgi:hypothetical protein